jgi:hypothetical protein
MHPNFADWYRSAAVTPPEGLLEKRWAAVEVLAKEATRESIVQLARLFALPNAEGMVPAGFREAFKEHDEGFAYKGGGQELRVLAGAILRTVIEQNGAHAVAAALSIACGAFGPRRATLPEQEHLEIAERFLIVVAKGIRKPESAPSLKVSTKKKLAELLPASVFAPNQTPSMHEPLIAILGELGSNFSSTQKAIDQLTVTVAVQAEEINALWWLQTSFSRTLQKPFSHIDHTVAAIILSSELAELTTFRPGLESTTAILAHALHLAGASRSGAGITIADAVNAAPREWREEVRASRNLDSIAALCPISFALNKSLETDGPNDWLPVYKKACDVRADLPFDQLQLAVQLFRELMLVREVNEQQS